MKTFRVMHSATHQYQAVKVGFNWPSFWLGCIALDWVWLMACGMWGRGVLFLLANILIATPFVFIPVVLWLFCAFQGNNWRYGHLLGHGYEQVATILAPNEQAAIAMSLSKEDMIVRTLKKGEKNDENNSN